MELCKPPRPKLSSHCTSFSTKQWKDGHVGEKSEFLSCRDSLERVMLKSSLPMAAMESEKIEFISTGRKIALSW